MSYNRLIASFLLWLCIAPVALAEDSQIITVIVNEQTPAEDINGLVYELTAYGEVQTTISPTEEQIINSDVIAFISESNLNLQATIWHAINESSAKKIIVGTILPKLSQMADWQQGEEVEVYKLDGKTLDEPFLASQLKVPQSEVVVSASSYHQQVPAVVRKSNLVYLAPVTLRQKPYVVAKEAIQKLLSHQSLSVQSSLLLITNIDYNTNVEKLQNILVALRQKNIPFTLQVKVTTTDNKNNRIFKLRDNKPLLKLLQQAQKDGATLLMKNESLAAVPRDFEEMVIDKLYPIGSNYQYEGIPLRVQNTTNTYLPTIEGTIIEYIPLFLPYNVEDIAIAQEVMATDLHTYKDVKTIGFMLQYPAYGKVDELIKYIAVLDTVVHYEWQNLREVPLRVDSKDVSVIQGHGFQVVQHTAKWRMLLKRYQDNPAELLLWAMALFVLLFVMLFFANTAFLRMTLRKRLFNERN